ncbi:hypothetical protein L486_02170 [Kwoniella mangroviensis CBS 10435]|uniref:BTB domain-containing protein n=1 Tax=Kwoniella mangroviensis CBS 10435 TaxID=1331196 RepID=A0A1B9IVF3_9TREE|nr:uncharacterized protein I203_04666 [Kwoniella mangroviensis CBS 8507]OCF59503.1 hypothetical protein L486_02170 [Kwoniella mangroviensis CBS 10435]OCF66335.1 hypothetical protein I203_04666 [Kwoniella mangroviensis CBS 8507]OCF73473.1 hypothetical protein I204_05314 [Kwoniella mangroviensis CBS 8886]
MTSTASQTPSKKPTGKEDEVHWFHCHGDVSLRTTNKIIFKFYSYRLECVSTVFKDMFEIGGQNTSTGNKRKSPPDADVIDVGFNSKVLGIFLDMINVPTPAPPATNFSSSLALYEFCEKFDIHPRLRDIIKNRLLQCARYNFAWDLLIWSAGRDNIEMARKALERMTSQVFLCPQMYDENLFRVIIPFWVAMSKLPRDWQYDLLRLTLLSPPTMWVYGSHSDHKALMEVTEDWVDVASKFDPSN